MQRGGLYSRLYDRQMELTVPSEHIVGQSAAENSEFI
jgi:hypothetical protein